MKQVALPSALVICTLHRPARIRELLEHLDRVSAFPRVVVVVDSSDDTATAAVVERAKGKSSLNLVYLHANRGAAHQKNVGLDYLRDYDHDPTEVVHFLDDDVLPGHDYFETVVALFRQKPDAAIIGGFDISLAVGKSSCYRRLALLGKGNKSGVILKSGICLVPFPKERLEKVSFVPGGMLNLRGDLARHLRYDGRVRIYGDEVEFQLRVRDVGAIYSSSVLPVNHKSETIAKDSQRVEQGYMDGFRWSLAVNYPKIVGKSAVIYTTLVLFCGELCFWIARRDLLAKTRAFGHLDFLRRLMSGQSVQQYVTHEGSGPHQGAKRI